MLRPALRPNDYLGIPYVPHGHTHAGVDCWGLVRLVYAERYGIELPTPERYDPLDGAAVAGLVAGPMRDEWRLTEAPQVGDVVLLRVMGYPSHIGLLCAPGAMLHAREGHAVCVERLDTGAWKHRLVAYYTHGQHAATKELALHGRPHPLRTVTLSAVVQEGRTLQQLVAAECERAGVPPQLVGQQGHAWIDGEYIPAEEWAVRVPRAGQRVEYRVLPAGGNLLRNLLMVVVVVVAAYVGSVVGGIYGAGWGAAAAAGVTMVGSALVNAIAPIRMPNQDMDGDQPERRGRLTGGSNRAEPYAGVPVVLGQQRFTAPLAAENYVEVEGGETYLRMALCWGYGEVDVSDLRIGDTQLELFEEVQQAHIRGTGSETSAQWADFHRLYGRDVDQETVGVRLTKHTSIERTIGSQVDELLLNFHFPNGLWSTAIEGGEAGQTNSVRVAIRIEYRTAGAGAWAKAGTTAPARTVTLPPSYQLAVVEYSNSDGGDASWWSATYGAPNTNLHDHVTVPLWRWHVVGLDRDNGVVVRSGAPTDRKDQDPSEAIAAVLRQAGYVGEYGDTQAANSAYQRLPRTTGLIPLWEVCVLEDAVVEVRDVRTFGAAAPVVDVYTPGGEWVPPATRTAVLVSGCALTYSGTTITVAAGVVGRTSEHAIDITRNTKDAFDVPYRIPVPTGAYDVRVQLRTGDSNEGDYGGSNEAVFYRDCYWTTLTGLANARPIVPPKPLALSAFRIRASNQLTGTLEGITATVRSVCLDYDRTSGLWVRRHTRNPASLFRYVLQHPACAVPVADAGINLSALQQWHRYCRLRGYHYDNVLTGTARSMLEVLRDIAAAGRASPTLVDGRWSVVVDEPKPTIVQAFTPHNSWAFSGTRALPRMPHGLRVRFLNAARGYQEDEMTVYADGYSAGNATLLERIELPGVTEPGSIRAFGRFHLAQLQLRPDTYTLMADAEHLICTRGDRVRVTHDVPMWGRASGRITAVTRNGSNQITAIAVDESIALKASGEAYTLRVRKATGAQITCTISAPGADGEYSTLTVATPFVDAGVQAGDLVLFGLLGAESVDLLVQSIEPGPNHTARLTLVDYAPAVFTADTEAIPPWDSQITLPPRLRRGGVTLRPGLRQIRSDERALLVTESGTLMPQIMLSYTVPANRNAQPITHCEVQIARGAAAEAENAVWRQAALVPLAQRSVAVRQVRELQTYLLRMRFVTEQGRTGPWCDVIEHTVTGRTNPPAPVTGATYQLVGRFFTIDWDDNDELDLAGYEVRRTNTGWGTGGHLWRGKASGCRLNLARLGLAASTTFYIRAYDRGRRYSATSAAVGTTLSKPQAPVLTASVRGATG